MKKILILASNPRKDLDLNCEIRDLKAAIKRNKDFIVEIEPAVQLEKLQSHFHEYHPYIVHFCGHGAGNEGLVVDRGKLLSNNALSGLFKIFGAEVECVLLNACTTEIQANAIGEYVPYVVGTSREISDRAAYLFAVGFYEALGYGETIERCYELGCNAIKIGLSRIQILPEISETSRKFEVVDLEATQASTEPLKIILQRNSALSDRKLSANIPSKFPETILEEVDRKDYYDNLRDVLTRFGQTTIKRKEAISKFEYEQRQTFLNKVKEFWIEGFLKPSLYFNTAIDKNKSDSSQILRPLDSLEVISVDIDSSYDELHQTDIMGQIGDGKTLLILGNPGSGKTIALLQLAERLIEQTQDMTKPIPVVFNLSSWGQKQQPLTEWLIEELKEKYQVPKTWSEPWIKNQQLTLLLDGLDEVKANCRNACVRAINKFVATHLETEIVVCSRVKDYEALAERLLLSSAICIQPLSTQQLADFLKNADDSLLGLKTVIERDREIAEFAQAPLILNMMTWTYQGWSAEQCQKQFRIAKDREFNLFESYIEKSLSRKNREKKYLNDKVFHWLNWLAQTMIEESKIIFLIESMQLTWLKTTAQKWLYSIVIGPAIGIIYGIIFGIIYYEWDGDLYLSKGLGIEINVLLITSLIGSSGVGLIFLITKINSKHLREKFRQGIYSLGIGSAGVLISFLCFARTGAKQETALVISFCIGLYAGIRDAFRGGASGQEFDHIIPVGNVLKLPPARKIKNILLSWMITLFVLGLFLGILAEFPGNIISWSIVSLIIGLICGLANLVTLPELEILKRKTPNQGVWQSAKSSVLFTLVFPVIAIILRIFLVKLIPDIPISDLSLWGIVAGLFAGLYKGGNTCIQHFILRLTLYCTKHNIPWNYAHFLDYASERLLMKKVGGGYIFYHRMLMEHFAQRH